MKITVRNLQTKIPLRQKTLRLAKKAVLKTLKRVSPGSDADISLCIMSDKDITGLNSRYLGINKPTDCIAFNLGQDKRGKVSADIAVSAQTALKNSKIFRTTFQNELILYAIHGTLHILGYDDNNRKNRKLMRKKEAEILSALSTPNS